MSGSMMDNSKGRHFLSRLVERISLDDLVKLWAFSGILRATIDILLDSRLPNFFVFKDIEPPKPRFRPTEVFVDTLSSTEALSSATPAIASSLMRPVILFYIFPQTL